MLRFILILKFSKFIKHYQDANFLATIVGKLSKFPGYEKLEYVNKHIQESGNINHTLIHLSATLSSLLTVSEPKYKWCDWFTKQDVDDLTWKYQDIPFVRSGHATRTFLLLGIRIKSGHLHSLPPVFQRTPTLISVSNREFLWLKLNMYFIQFDGFNLKIERIT